MLLERFPNEIVKSKVENIPSKPGVYQYKNSTGTIIYVGKAKNLRNRVRSYFQQGRIVDAKTKALISHIVDLEFIVVDSESEALLLEDTLIKKLQPKYNVLLRDDKTYPYIKVTNEEFPKIFATRKVIKDGSKYFGPYTDGRNLKQILKLIRTVFLIRSCDLPLNEKGIQDGKYKVCLDFFIGKCEAPCVGYISKEAYRKNIDKAMMILSGKSKEIEKQLEEEMFKLSDELKFEKANILKNRIIALQEFDAKQKIVSKDFADRDVFGYFKQDDYACSVVLKIRDGKLIGKRHYIIKNALRLRDEDIVRRTIEQWYQESDFIPREICLPLEIDEMEMLSDWLTEQRQRTIDIHIPKLGDKRKMVEMANTNAEYSLKEYLIAYDKREQVLPRAVLSLQRDLRMSKAPRWIECFDNSHIQGTDLVSSLVVFQDGKPKKSAYRKFKARGESKNDDFGTMKDTVYRRYKRMLDEKQPLPDLVIIDGGKGQLSSAMLSIDELGLRNKFMVIGLAKRLEEVFFVDEEESMLLPRTSSSLRLVQQVRDEAHRFAITFHRQLRDKRTLTSELTELKGIGKITSQKLLTKYGSLANILKQSDAELSKLVNKNIINALRAYDTNTNE
ncbi:MAG TPA: excinuclease ABC subunit UvrC [Candidatus Kapabacteria bacterium]|nr:excinuclease ABC subunit UvrC [Candidatus Kapabacteria bacterium]